MQRLKLFLFYAFLMFPYFCCNYESDRCENNLLSGITGLKIKPGNKEGTIKINWRKLEGADNYTFQVFLNPGDSIIAKEGTVTKSKAKIKGLPSGKKVYVRVKGNMNGMECSPWTNLTEFSVQ